MTYKKWFSELVMEHTDTPLPTIPTSRIWGGLSGGGIRVPARRKYLAVPKYVPGSVKRMLGKESK